MKRIYPAFLLLLLSSCKLTDGSQLDGEDGIKKTEPKTQLTLNDVSILMPLIDVPELQNILPRIGDIPAPEKIAPGEPAAAADGLPFVPLPVWQQMKELLEENRKEILKATEAGTAEEYVFNSGFDDVQENQTMSFTANGNTFADAFRLVSLRFDPCLNMIDAKGNDDKCTRELRLNFQPVYSSDGKLGFIDFNVHAIYGISKQEMTEIVTTLKALSAASGVDTSKMPLQMHPVIAKEGVNSAYLKGILGIVHRYAHATKLTSLAFLADTAPNIQGHWPMLKAEVKDGVASFVNVPFAQTSKLKTFANVQRLNGHGVNLEAPVPAGTSKDDFYTSDRLTNINRTFRVDNPKINDNLRVDCASCHTTMQERSANYYWLTKEGKTVKVPSSAFTSKKWDLSNVTLANESSKPVAFQTFSDGTSLQMFAFFMSKVKIAQRTINESAVIADYFNERY